MSREIKYNKEARKKLKKGVDSLANAVKVTLGARGRNVIIHQDYDRPPHVTKDGVTVAQNIELPDPVENMGAQIVLEAASNAAKSAGDGTTTATILAQSIINESLKTLDDKNLLERIFGKSFVNPMDLKRGIDKGVEAMVERLDWMSDKIEGDRNRIKEVATISANGDEEIGELIAETMMRVTSDGIATIEESKNTKTFIDVVDGLRFVNGLLHPVFVTNEEKMIGEYEKPNILFVNGKVNTTREILPIIEMGIKTQKPLVVVANDFDGDVIITFAKNRVEKGYKIVPIKAPAYGELRRESLEDLAIVTGGTIMTEENGITPDTFTEEMFGTCDKIEVSREHTTILGGHGDNNTIEKRINDLKNQIDDKTQEWDDEEIRSRIARLRGGVAVIYVGANTEVEMKEKKDRVEDALEATKSAMEEGIVAGGGIALLEASDALEDLNLGGDQQKGVGILLRAVRKPLMQIAFNSGLKPKEVLNKVMTMGYPNGYDAKNNNYGNMFDKGIVDPKKVTRIALESAASTATMIFTSEATINIINQK